MRHARLAVRLLVLAAAFLGAAASAQTRYQLVDIAPIGTDFSNAAAINARGQVVGQFGFTSYGTGTFLYDAATGLTDLSPVITGTGSPVDSAPSDISDTGIVTGYQGYPTRGFRYSAAGGFESLGPNDGSLFTYLGTGVNDAGQVVLRGAGGFLSSPGSATLQPLGTEAPEDINNAGTVAGIRYLRDASGAYLGARAVTESGGVVTSLGVLGGNDSAAHAINEGGAVAGSSTVEVDGVITRHAFLWTASGGLVDIDTRGLSPRDYEETLAGPNAGSAASGLNDRGQVVGTSWAQAMAPSQAFVYDAVFGMRDLNALLDPVSGAGWTLLAASDINDRGQIVGMGEFNGVQRAFLLNPLAAPVPEPAAWAAMAVGLVLLGARRRRSAPAVA